MRRTGMRRMTASCGVLEGCNLIAGENSWIVDENNFYEVHIVNNLSVKACCYRILSSLSLDWSRCKLFEVLSWSSS